MSGRAVHGGERALPASIEDVIAVVWRCVVAAAAFWGWREPMVNKRKRQTVAIV